MRREEMTRLFQGAIIGFIFVGFYEGETGVIVNSVVGLAITFLPEILERDTGVALSPKLSGWIFTAVFLHSFGTLGPYQNLWWWDHMTHAVSSSVVAGAGYVAVMALDRYDAEVTLPKKFLWVFLLTFTMAFGVVWEVLEFFLGMLGEIIGFKALTQYGIADTMMDLVFDSVGAAIVAVLGSSQLGGVVKSLRER